MQYLGAPIGVRLSKTQIQDYCLDWVCIRISSQKSKHLSLTARIIVIKQILMAIPVYHQMYMHFSTDATMKLQRLCKDFLNLGLQPSRQMENSHEFMGQNGTTQLNNRATWDLNKYTSKALHSWPGGPLNSSQMPPLSGHNSSMQTQMVFNGKTHACSTATIIALQIKYYSTN